MELLEIDKTKVFVVSWNELKNSEKRLCGLSGIYFYHVNGSLKYIGKADCYWTRFEKGYFNEDNNHNPKLAKLIKSFPNEVAVVFLPMDKEDIDEQEVLFIEEWLPLLNKQRNPMESIRAIQQVIGRVVNLSNRGWSYNEMKEHLCHKWNGKVSNDAINTALVNKSGNLSRYCSTNGKQKVLMPKKKTA